MSFFSNWFVCLITHINMSCINGKNSSLSTSPSELTICGMLELLLRLSKIFVIACKVLFVFLSVNVNMLVSVSKFLNDDKLMFFDLYSLIIDNLSCSERVGTCTLLSLLKTVGKILSNLVDVTIKMLLGLGSSNDFNILFCARSLTFSKFKTTKTLCLL